MYLCDKNMSFKFLLSTVLLLIYSINNASAGFSGDCTLEGLGGMIWIMGHTINPPINDTHRGFVASFKTKNIKSVTVQNKIKYLDARLENSDLIIFTAEAFEDFEEEAQAARITAIRINLKFECNDGTDTLDMIQNVIDINNHDPTFTKKIYEYNFGMTIPEKFDLTSVFPISASDGDFTNYKISFSYKEEPSKNFELRPNRNMISKYHHITLTAKNNLTSPFREEFDIVAMDDGKPNINKTAKVIVTVDLIFNEENKKKIPYFSKNLYYGNYTLNDEVQMDIISFKEIMLSDITILQSDYENNFKIYYDAIHEEVKLDVIQPIHSQKVLNDNFITIQIEAQVEEFNVQTNTVLMIFMPRTDNNTTTNEKEKINNYCFISFPNSSHNFNILPTIIYLAIVIVLVFCTMVLILIYRKNQITRSETFQVHDTLKIDELYITK